MAGNWEGANVCKYFLSGRCRFGDRCRYLHTQPEAGGGGGRSVLQKSYDNYSSNYFSAPQQRYHNDNYVQSQDYYHNQGQNLRSQSPFYGQGQGQRSTTNYSQQGYRKSHNDHESPTNYIHSISEYCRMVEQHGLWPFSSFGFLSGHGSLPGWDDYSPEEVRWAFYKARVEGALPSFEAALQQHTKKAAGLRLIFLKPGKLAETILSDYLAQKADLYNVPQAPNIFDSANRPPPPASTFSFSSALQPSLQNKFETTAHWPQSTFGSQRPQAQNVFNVSQPSFGPPQTNIFGQVSFSGQSKAETMEMEGAVVESRPPQENIFGRMSTSFSLPPVSNPGTASIFGGVSAPSGDSSYSKMEVLSLDDIEQFKATKFTMDKLPFVPPPKELCGFT